MGAALVVAAGTALWGWLRPGAAPSVRRATEVQLPQLSRLNASRAQLAPDGDAIVLDAEGRLWLRNLGESSGFHEIPGTEGAFGPFWSPDGEWIGFFRSRDLAKVRREGGSPITLAQLDLCCPPQSDADWLDDGRILFSTGLADLYVVDEDGGSAEVLLAAAEAEHFHRALLLPGNEIVVEVDPDDAPERIDLREGDTVRQVQWSYPTYAKSGHVLYQRDNSIWAVPYGPRSGLSTEDAFLVLQDAMPLSAARDGSLLGWRGGDRARTLVWVDRTGVTDELLTGLDDPVDAIPSVSPDGVLAYRNGRDIWLLDPARGAPQPVTGAVAADLPVWSRDGRRIYYEVREEGLEAGEGRIDVLDVASGRSTSVIEGGFRPTESPDARYLVYAVRAGTSGLELRLLDLGTPGADPVPFGKGPPIRDQAVISPTGELIAYRAGEAVWLMRDLWISRFPSGEEPLQVSTDGASRPRWSPDGSKLYFVRDSDGALLELEVSSEGLLTVSPAPTVLFDEVGSDLVLTLGFELNPSGDHFLGIREVTPRGGSREELILVQSWLSGTAGSRE